MKEEIHKKHNKNIREVVKSVSKTRRKKKDRDRGKNTKSGFGPKPITRHSERAQKLDRLDTLTRFQANVALKYFNNRCAFSGEKLVSYMDDEKRHISNRSLEHVIALISGGHNIASNCVPSVMDYNTKKNGYHPLDWWKSQTDINGNRIYNPYRLLKLVNYTIKSLDAIGIDDDRKYSKAILNPNEIDKFLEKHIEELESDVITIGKSDEDHAKLLQNIPDIDGYIPELRDENKNKFEGISIDSLLIESISTLEKDGMSKDIIEKLYKNFYLTKETKAFKRMPEEEKIHKEIVERLGDIGIKNVFTTSRFIDTKEIVSSGLGAGEYVDSKMQILRDLLDKNNFPEESLFVILENMPSIINEPALLKEKLNSSSKEFGNDPQKFLLYITNMNHRTIDNCYKLWSHWVDIHGRAPSHLSDSEEEREIAHSMIGAVKHCKNPTEEQKKKIANYLDKKRRTDNEDSKKAKVDKLNKKRDEFNKEYEKTNKSKSLRDRARDFITKFKSNFRIKGSDGDKDAKQR